MGYANINLELFKSGIHLTCEETGEDEFIPRGNGNMLMDIINHIEEICDPDAIFTLTEKGKEFLEKLKENDGTAI